MKRKHVITIKHKNKIVQNISWNQIVAFAKWSKHLAYMIEKHLDKKDATFCGNYFWIKMLIG